MKKWRTEILAIHPATGILTRWHGPNVPGESREDAEAYCQANGLGYCRVDEELVEEIHMPDRLVVSVVRKN